MTASPAEESMRPSQTTFFLLWAEEETVDLKLRAGRQPTQPVFSQAERLILFHNRDGDGNRLNGGDQVKERNSTRLTFPQLEPTALLFLVMPAGWAFCELLCATISGTIC